MLKKIFIVLGSLFVLFAIAVVALPMFIDANKYRPEIEKAVEDNMNADLDLGGLKFSLWGGLHISVEKLVLSEKGSQGKKPIFSMHDAKFNLPIFSVLSGRPDITLSVKNPDLEVIKGLDGKLNVSKLAKAKTPEEIAKAQQAQQQAKSGGGPGAAAALPFDFSVKVTGGKLVYADEVKKTKTTINGFDFELRKLTLNKPFGFYFKSDLDVKEMADLVLRGPFEIKGQAAVFLKSSGLDHADFETDVDLSKLTVKYVGLMNKDAGVPLKVAVKLSATDSKLDLQKAKLVIGDAAISASGTVDNFDNPVLNLSVASSNFVFDHWQTVIAPLKDFDMKGKADFSVKVSGALAKMNIDGKMGVSDVSLKAPGIVPRVTDVKATIGFSSDTASLTNAGMKLGTSDISFDGTVKNFNKPVIVFNVKSNLMDVDSLLPQKTPEQVKAEEELAKKNAGKEPEFDAEKAASGPIAAMKKNPTARALDFTARATMKKVKVHKADVDNITTELTFKDLVMNLKKASAQTFGGSVNFNSAIDFRGNDPAYSVSGDVTGLDVNAAITSQMAAMKDTLFGKMNAKFSVAGSGLSKAKVKNTLKGGGNFNIANGSWSSLKPLQQVGEKLKSTPGVQGALSNVNVSDKFRQLKADFNIASGKFNIVNMVADLEGSNATLNGAGYVDFDMNLFLAGKIIAPNLDLADLKMPDGRYGLPYEMGCLATSPCVKWDKTLGPVGTALAKREAGRQLHKVLDNNNSLPPAAKDFLKKLPF